MIQAIQFILSLSILIILHELGHFIPARLFKTRIEKFYLFFDPWFSIFKVKKGETEYGIGWLPLGGYVKIAGMIDESMDKEQMKQPAQPLEFRAKPAWQRLIIMCGGVIVNVLLGMLIYAFVLFIWGDKYLPTKNVKYGIACDSLGKEIGLMDGDKILTVDHKEVEDFHKLPGAILFNKATTIEVERDGKITEVKINPAIYGKMVKTQSFLFDVGFPCDVDTVLPGKGAEKAGLRKGDQIIGVGEKETRFFQQVREQIQSHKGADLALKVLRNKDTLVLHALVSNEGTIGFGPKSDMTKYFDIKQVKYGFFESIPAGVHRSVDKMGEYIGNMRVLFTVKDAHKSLVGFIGIGKMYAPVWDWERFWNFTGFLSLMLAIMNILPIPALDGGHVMFLLYEVITGRKPHEKVMEYAQYAGMILLLAAMLYVNGHDVIKLFYK